MRIPTNKGFIRIKGRLYQVQFGDSLFTISQKFDITIDDILAFNDQIKRPNTIFPGETLFIPTPSYLTNSKKGKKKN